MSLTRIVLLTGAMAMAGAAPAQQPWQVAEQLDLVPTPQQISLAGGGLEIAGWRIVVARGSVMAGVGAGEINDRVAALGGEELAVVNEPPAEGGAIVVGPCTDSVVAAVAGELGATITPDDPGPQGYLIEFGSVDGRPVILCAGSDDLGALYACVTLRHMIQVRENMIVALVGSVRDWPDFRYRCDDRVDLRGIQRAGDDEAARQAAVDKVKRQIDRCLRSKVNHVFGRLWVLAADETIRAAQEDVVAYAAARGIHPRFVGNTTIGEYLTDEQKQQAFEPRENRMYMWSALDAHREKARFYAETMRDVQAGMLALHPVDSGAYVDPEKWSQRPEPDRERYGDDRAAASIEQFKLYFDLIRERSPETLLEAVSYPYHYQFALPDFPERFQEMNVSPYGNWWRAIESEEQAREVQQTLMDYHRRVSEALDPSVFVTFREAGRDVFLACANLYEGHPVTIWTYPETYEGWHGTFFPQARYAKSFVREDYDDYFFMASGVTRARDPRAQYLAHAEYLWNSGVPDGSDEFTVSSRLYRVGGQVTDYQRESLIPRIARILYGGAAEEMAEVMAANVSYNYVALPADVMSSRGEDAEDTFAHMPDQAQKMEALSHDLAALMDRIEAGEVAGPVSDDIREDAAFGWVLFHYQYTGIGAVKARLEARADRCRKLLADGNGEEAARLAAEMRARIPDMAGICQRARERAAAAGVPIPGAGPTGEALDAFDPGSFDAVFQEIEQQAAQR